MLFLTEEEVGQLLTMKDAIREVEAALRAMGEGKVEVRPRQRVRMPHALLHIMPAGWPDRGYFGFKYYSSTRKRTRFWFHLFDAETGDLVAVIQADRLGQQRTGAASGVATKYLAPEDASIVGIIGTGWQAESQLEAVCAVRGIETVRCFGRDRAAREAFAKKMAAELGIDVRAVDSAEAAARGADIVVTATNASQPVLHGEWLEPGAHVNAIGSNRLEAREVDDEVVKRSAFIAVDLIEQAKIECGDLAAPIARGLLRWDRVHELGDVVAGRVKGRTHPEDITLFKSHGIAIEDVAVAAFVYGRARKERMGQELSL
ncbi:MAG: ornithine cyclodeaminase family protein [Candidatus Thermoplasmatota archaeon]